MYSLSLFFFFLEQKRFKSPSVVLFHVLVVTALCHVNVQIHYRPGSSCSKIKKSYPMDKSLFQVTLTVIV